MLNGEVVRSSDSPVAGGAYSDIWEGKWLGEEKVIDAILIIHCENDRQSSFSGRSKGDEERQSVRF